MTTKPILPHSRAIPCFIAAALAGTITSGIFSGVTTLLLRDGMPFQQQIAAERACSGRAYLSEREACVRDWFAVRRHVAQRSDGPQP